MNFKKLVLTGLVACLFSVPVNADDNVPMPMSNAVKSAYDSLEKSHRAFDTESDLGFQECWHSLYRKDQVLFIGCLMDIEMIPFSREIKDGFLFPETPVWAAISRSAAIPCSPDAYDKMMEISVKMGADVTVDSLASRVRAEGVDAFTHLKSERLYEGMRKATRACLLKWRG